MLYADSYCSHVKGTEGNDEKGIVTYTFTGPCVVTGREQSVTVKAPDLFKYRQGGYVQDCFPYLENWQREFLISGISDEGWKIIFGAGKEEDSEN